MQRSMGCFSAQDDTVVSTLDSSTCPAKMVFFKMPVNLFSQVDYGPCLCPSSLTYNGKIIFLISSHL